MKFYWRIRKDYKQNPITGTKSEKEYARCVYIADESHRIMSLLNLNSVFFVPTFKLNDDSGVAFDDVLFCMNHMEMKVKEAVSEVFSGEKIEFINTIPEEDMASILKKSVS